MPSLMRAESLPPPPPSEPYPFSLTSVAEEPPLPPPPPPPSIDEVDEVDAFLSPAVPLQSPPPRRASILPSHMRALAKHRLAQAQRLSALPMSPESTSAPASAQPAAPVAESCDAEVDHDSIEVQGDSDSDSDEASSAPLRRETCAFADAIVCIDAPSGPRVFADSGAEVASNGASESGHCEHWLVTTRNLYCFTPNAYEAPRRCVPLMTIDKLVCHEFPLILLFGLFRHV